MLPTYEEHMAGSATSLVNQPSQQKYQPVNRQSAPQQLTPVNPNQNRYALHPHTKQNYISKSRNSLQMNEFYVDNKYARNAWNFSCQFFVKCKNLESIEFSNFNLKRHSQEALGRQDGNKNYITHVGNGYQRAPAYQNHWNQQHQNVYQNDRVVPTYDQFFGPPPHTVSTSTVFTKPIFKIQNSSNVY